MFKPYYKDNNGNLKSLGLHVEKSDVAAKLGTQSIGSVSEPIYLKDGSPQKCTNLKTSIIDLIYPIGSIYMSVNAVNPNSLFGGMWEQIKDKFLLGSGTYQNGSVGGESTHTLTVNEMPSHTHTQNEHTHTQDQHNHLISNNGRHGMNGKNSNYAYSDGDSKSNSNAMYTGNATPTIHGTTATNNYTGGGQPHNNMPPYIAVNIWKRIS